MFDEVMEKHGQAAKDTAKQTKPRSRPFPKPEGRHSSNEKENHWVKLGFEFQPRRHHSLFVDSQLHHWSSWTLPSKNSWYIW